MHHLYDYMYTLGFEPKTLMAYIIDNVSAKLHANGQVIPSGFISPKWKYVFLEYAFPINIWMNNILWCVQRFGSWITTINIPVYYM
jgi:hypothetical protein